MLKLFVATVALLAAASAVPMKVWPSQGFGGRIVNGEDTTIEQYPHQISLRYFGGHNCGGSIVNSDTIVTAAHCVNDFSQDYLSITVGSTNVDGGISHDISSIYVHPQYNDRTFDYDVAIIKLVDTIEFNDRARAITMQTEGDDVAAGTVATVTGWGALYEGDDGQVDILQKVDIDVKSEAECKDKYGSSRITARMLCGARDGKDSCQGDSGGPLVAGGKLIGVVSWGIGCARPSYPGIYSKISNLRGWIDQNI